MGVVLQTGFKPLYDARCVSLIRSTVCKDCNDQQFDNFLYIARFHNLDPLLKQIHCLVLNKGKKDKEQMVAVIGIGGYRSLAARQGNYLPDDQEPKIVRRKSLIDETNPCGIVSATVFEKIFMEGSWHRVAGKCRWAEYAPLKERYAYNPETGCDEPTGVKYLPKTNRWFQSPELMIAKCASADALRKGWPTVYANIFDDCEFDRYKVLELSPSEFARMGDNIERDKQGITVDWLDDKPLELVPIDQFKDRVFKFIEHEPPRVVIALKDRNRVAFNQFWSFRKADALEIRKKFAAVETVLNGK